MAGKNATKSSFVVKKLETKWCVLERSRPDPGLGLVSYWETRDQAREAARQLNVEERRALRDYQA